MILLFFSLFIPKANANFFTDNSKKDNTDIYHPTPLNEKYTAPKGTKLCNNKKLGILKIIHLNTFSGHT